MKRLEEQSNIQYNINQAARATTAGWEGIGTRPYLKPPPANARCKRGSGLERSQGRREEEAAARGCGVGAGGTRKSSWLSPRSSLFAATFLGRRSRLFGDSCDEGIRRSTQTQPTGLWFRLALFSSKKFCKIDTVALSFVFDKYYPIMD